MTAKPDVAAVKAVVEEVLQAIGTETMSQSWDAIGDLLWDYHPTYQHLPPEEQAAWQAAFRAELEGGYER
ncbi:hypothetical protein [Streptomyces sp. LN704]|uniref:hypothetical protein n=1 Tax=Streptomyces sp. LN704 TaxID=3112982 RepID=UPI00371EE0DB